MKDRLYTLGSFVSGLLFALGLGISGMTHPSKVLGFLDFFGRWDPSLMFVMGGAVLVSAIAFRFVLRLRAPLLADRFHLPTQTKVDRSLVLGSVLFGIGWGLSGYCPGPVISSVVTLSPPALVFLSAMLVGMALHRAFAIISRRKSAPSSTALSPS